MTVEYPSNAIDYLLAVFAEDRELDQSNLRYLDHRIYDIVMQIGELISQRNTAHSWEHPTDSLRAVFSDFNGNSQAYSQIKPEDEQLGAWMFPSVYSVAYLIFLLQDDGYKYQEALQYLEERGIFDYLAASGRLAATYDCFDTVEILLRNFE